MNFNQLYLKLRRMNLSLSQNEFNEITNELWTMYPMYSMFSLFLCALQLVSNTKSMIVMCVYCWQVKQTAYQIKQYLVLISMVKLDSEAKARAQSLPRVPCRCTSGYCGLPPRPSINTMLWNQIKSVFSCLMSSSRAKVHISKNRNSTICQHTGQPSTGLGEAPQLGRTQGPHR